MDRTLIQQRLTEAEAKYHQLVIGGQPKVFVDQNGERVEYTQASAARLAAYITQLRNLLSGCSTGPLNVWM